MRSIWTLTALAALSLTPAAAKEPQLDEAKVKAAIEKGLAWIKARQSAEGSWDEGYKSAFPQGPSALGALTLIKGGGYVGQDGKDPAIAKAFAYLGTTQNTKTYGAGLLLMAIEALYAPNKQQQAKAKDSFSTLVRKRFKKAKGPHKQMLFGGAQWLIKTKHSPMWGYPFGGGFSDPFGSGGSEWDHSNTQYALLGLGAAGRMGFKSPPGPLLEVLEQILAGQEPSGPKVEPFFVPAAEAPFKEIERLAKDLAKARAAAAKGKADGTVTRIREFHETYEPGQMFARGWAYFPVGGPGKGPRNPHPAAQGAQMYQAGPSMTAASLAIVILLKAALEDQGAYKKRFKAKVDQAIRNGAAYLAHNWTLNDSAHPYYYLYGLERVGVLTGCQRLGDHFWDHEGPEAPRCTKRRRLLGRQPEPRRSGRPRAAGQCLPADLLCDPFPLALHGAHRPRAS